MTAKSTTFTLTVLMCALPLGLLLMNRSAASATTTRTILVPLPDQVDFEDYRDVDGIKLPFTIRTSDASVFSTTTRRFTEIKHNVAVDDNVFNLPATQP